MKFNKIIQKTITISIISVILKVVEGEKGRTCKKKLKKFTLRRRDDRNGREEKGKRYYWTLSNERRKRCVVLVVQEIR